jgi:hypothetical protein
MKYTKKQIEKGFVKWETFQRLNPKEVMTDSEVKALNVKEAASEQTITLINFINN